MLFHDRTLSIESQNLEGRAESVQEDSEEEYSATLEKSIHGRLHVEEDGAEDQSHCCIAEKLGERQRWVASQPPEPTTKAQADLLTV